MYIILGPFRLGITSKMAPTVQFLVEELSCRPMHREVVAAAMGLLVAADSTATHPASYEENGRSSSSSSSTKTHAAAPSTAETPIVSWRYTLSREPNARTPMVPFSLPHFEAFAALIAGGVCTDSNCNGDSGRKISSSTDHIPASTSSVSIQSWRNLSQDALKALQFVPKTSDAVPNNSNESEDQASCLIVAFCAVPTSNSDGIETLQTLESNLKRRGVKLLVVDTSGRDQPPSSCSSSGSNKKESVSKACTAMGISIVSLHKLVHALSFLPPKLCMPIICPLAFPGVLPSADPQQLMSTTTTTHVFLPKPPRLDDGTAEEKGDEGISNPHHENAPLLESNAVLAGNRRRQQNWKEGRQHEENDEAEEQGDDQLMWLGSFNLVPWMRNSHRPPCGCPPPSAFVVHARVEADAPLSTCDEELKEKKQPFASLANDTDEGTGSSCSFEPFVLTVNPSATSPLDDSSNKCGRRSSAEAWVDQDEGTKAESFDKNDTSKNNTPRFESKSSPNLRRYELACAKGHPMSQAQVQRGAACDGCTQKVRKGKAIWSCRRCNYDLCEACAAAIDAKSSHDGLEAFLHDLSSTNEVALVSWPRCHSKGCCGVAVEESTGEVPCNDFVDDDGGDDDEGNGDRKDYQSCSGLVFGIVTPLPIPGCALLRPLDYSQAAAAAAVRGRVAQAIEETAGITDAASAATSLLPSNGNPHFLDSHSSSRSDTNSDTLALLPFVLAEPLPANKVAPGSGMDSDEENEEDFAALVKELNQRVREQQEKDFSNVASATSGQQQEAAARVACIADVGVADKKKSTNMKEPVELSRDYTGSRSAVLSTSDNPRASDSTAETPSSATNMAEAVRTTLSCEPSHSDVKSIESLGNWFTSLCNAFEQSGHPLLDDIIFEALPNSMAAARKLADSDDYTDLDGRTYSTSLVDVLKAHFRVKCAQLSAEAAAEAKRQKKRARKAHAKGTKIKGAKKQKVESSKNSSSKSRSDKSSSQIIEKGEGELVSAGQEERTISLEASKTDNEAIEAREEQNNETLAAERALLLATRVSLRQYCLALMLLLVLPPYDNSKGSEAAKKAREREDQDKDEEESKTGKSAHDLSEGLRIVREFVPRLAILMADPSRRQSNAGANSSSSSNADTNNGSMGSGSVGNGDEAEQMVDGVPYSSAETLLRRLYTIPDVRAASAELLNAAADELGIDFSSSDDDNDDRDDNYENGSSGDSTTRLTSDHPVASAAPPIRFNHVWKLPSPPETPAESITSVAAATAAGGANSTVSATSAVALASRKASTTPIPSGPSIAGAAPAVAAGATAVAFYAPVASSLKAAAGAAKAKQHGKIHLNRLRTTQTTKTVVQPVRTSSNTTSSGYKFSSSSSSSSSNHSRRRADEPTISEKVQVSKKRKEATSRQPSNDYSESSSSSVSMPAAPSSPSTTSSSSSSRGTPSQQVLVGETPTKKPAQKAIRERRLEMPMWHSDSP